jgi:hypothetical protein
MGAAFAGSNFMRWFRASRAKLTWLALFVLTCQIVLSFGHVHVGKFSNSPGELAVLAHAGDGGGASGGDSKPPQKNPNNAADDFCAICASISLASTLIVPTAPATVPPISFIRELPWSTAAAEPARSAHFLFDARGPPQA